MNRRTLILFAHPYFSKSKANRALVEHVHPRPGVTFHDLYESYPDFVIDVEHEKKLLSDHDLIVFHHPIYWYSTPAILKEWQDQVLQHGWAYGHGGTALKGKDFVSFVTCGGSPEAYSPEGLHGITLTELLAPLRATARLCGMRWNPPIVLYGARALEGEPLATAAAACARQLESIMTASPDALNEPTDQRRSDGA